MTKKIEKRTEEQKENIVPLENAGRRKAVKTIVGGVTAVAAYNLLPSKWGIPIIEQIYLPAHAATSGTSLHDPCEVTWVEGYQDSNTVIVNVTGFVTPPTGNLPTTIVATGNPDATATSTVNTSTADDGTFSATITLTTATGLGTVGVTTTVEGADGSASCSVDIPQQAAADTAPAAAAPDHELYVKSIQQNGTRIETNSIIPGSILSAHHVYQVSYKMTKSGRTWWFLFPYNFADTDFDFAFAIGTDILDGDEMIVTISPDQPTPYTVAGVTSKSIIWTV